MTQTLCGDTSERRTSHVALFRQSSRAPSRPSRHNARRTPPRRNARSPDATAFVYLELFKVRPSRPPPRRPLPLPGDFSVDRSPPSVRSCFASLFPHLTLSFPLPASRASRSSPPRSSIAERSHYEPRDGPYSVAEVANDGKTRVYRNADHAELMTTPVEGCNTVSDLRSPSPRAAIAAPWASARFFAATSPTRGSRSSR